MRKLIFFSLAMFLSILSYGNSIFSLEIDNTNSLELVSAVAFTMIIVVFGQTLGLYGVNYYLKLSKTYSTPIFYLPFKFKTISILNIVCCLMLISFYAVNFYIGELNLYTFFILFNYGVLSSLISQNEYNENHEIKGILFEKFHLVIILIAIPLTNVYGIETTFGYLFTFALFFLIVILVNGFIKISYKHDYAKLDASDRSSLTWTYGNALIAFIFLYLDQILLGTLTDSSTFATYFLLVQFLSLYKFFPMQASKIMLKEFSVSDKVDEKLISSVIFYTLTITPIILFAYLFFFYFDLGGKYQPFIDNIKLMTMLASCSCLGLVINQYLISIQRSKQLFIVNFSTMAISTLLLLTLGFLNQVTLENVLLVKVAAVIISQLMLVVASKGTHSTITNMVMNCYLVLIFLNCVSYIYLGVAPYIYFIATLLVGYAIIIKYKFRKDLHDLKI